MSIKAKKIQIAATCALFYIFSISAFSQEDPQSPLTIKPKLDLGFEYNKDYSSSINPGISLVAEFKSGTNKKIGFEISYNFTLKEYLTEDNVIAENNIESTTQIRDYKHVIALTTKSDITSKINLELKGDVTFYRVNTYEQTGADSDTFTLGPKSSFTGIQYTTLSVGYTYTGANSTHKSNTLTTDEYAFDTESQRELRGSILVYPYSDYTEFGTDGGSDSFFVGLDGTVFDSGEEVPTFKQTHDIGLSGKVDTKMPYVPSGTLGYNFIPAVDSNNDKDDGFGHVFKIGVKQPLWPKASLGLDYKLGINGYNNQTDTSGEYIKFSYPNTITTSLSQDIVTWLNAKAGYEYKYTASNNAEDDGKKSYKVTLGLSAFF